MRLLLDEIFPPAVARALRERGYDVVAVLEVDGLVGADDAEVFSWAQPERRAIVTENVPDFLSFDAYAREEGQSHHGLLFLRKEGLPRKRPQFVGALVRKLATELDAHPGTDADSRLTWP